MHSSYVNHVNVYFLYCFFPAYGGVYSFSRFQKTMLIIDGMFGFVGRNIWGKRNNRYTCIKMIQL